MYTKDSFHVYWKGEKIHGAFSNNFEVMDDEYGKDPFRVYYKGNVLKGAFPNSFEIPKRRERRSIKNRDKRFDGNFSEEVINPEIDNNGILEGFLLNGRRKKVSIDLNYHLGNNNGKFDTKGENFSDTSRNLRVVYKGQRLSGELQNTNGSWDYDSVDLDDILEVRDRNIIFVPDWKRNYYRRENLSPTRSINPEIDSGPTKNIVVRTNNRVTLV